MREEKYNQLLSNYATRWEKRTTIFLHSIMPTNVKEADLQFERKYQPIGDEDDNQL
jgi:hypothetical protein